ncbi:hypothetical protein MY4038_006949 [Beauveria bassiana]
MEEYQSSFREQGSRYKEPTSHQPRPRMQSFQTWAWLGRMSRSVVIGLVQRAQSCACVSCSTPSEQ